jgi:RING finger protein 121
VLNRDLAIEVALSMATRMGYYSKSGLPSKSLPKNTCAICDNPLFESVRLDVKLKQSEETVHTLNCGHQYHDFCLRGWCLIGKKDT